MKHKIKRLMAYIYMPLIFTLLGYSLAYIALTPVLEMLQAMGSMVIAKESPNFNTELKSIYDSCDTETIPTSNSLTTEEEPEAVAIEEESDGIIAEKESEGQVVVSVGEIEFPDYETKYAVLSCARIGMEAPVYWGDSKAVLKAGVGNYMGGFMPGFGKPILISGHNTTFFKPLKIIEVGDVITYDTNYGSFEYQVSEISILYVTDATATMKQLLSNEEEQLIMYTCYPFETLVGTKMDRLFVFADKISGPAVE